jgi:hypothetical protein
MTPREIEEYKALRATIRERGTTRVWIVLAGLTGWALTAVGAIAVQMPPVVTFIPLLVLIATFEIAYSLHMGVERIGRYIQVFFEDDGASAGWEHRIMNFPATGLRRPIGGDPLFATSFWVASLANLIPAVFMAPNPIEWLIVGVGHLMFGLRVATARQQASRQRAADLERFREMKDRR